MLTPQQNQLLTHVSTNQLDPRDLPSHLHDLALLSQCINAKWLSLQRFAIFEDGDDEEAAHWEEVPAHSRGSTLIRAIKCPSLLHQVRVGLTVEGWQVLQEMPRQGGTDSGDFANPVVSIIHESGTRDIGGDGQYGVAQIGVNHHDMERDMDERNKLKSLRQFDSDALANAGLPQLSYAQLWRAVRDGTKARSGVRIRLESVRMGRRLFTTASAIERYGRELATADINHFDRRTPRVAGSRRGGRVRRPLTQESRQANVKRASREAEALGL